MKLHLGCGRKHIPGFMNVDIQSFPSVDLVADISKLPFEDNSVDLIYTCATIEHFPRWEWVDVLRHWYSKLSVDGVLELSTADFAAAVEQYHYNKDIEELIGLVNGGQKDFTDRHGMIFDFRLMSAGMKKAGFRKVERVGHWGLTPYMDDPKYDDYAAAMLPHMDFLSGRAMMFSVKAYK